MRRAARPRVAEPPRRRSRRERAAACGDPAPRSFPLPEGHVGSPSAAAALPATSRLLRSGGMLFLGLGLLGHLFAAHAIGGDGVAYVHHVGGFLLILVVTGGVVAGLGWRFWRSRSDVTVLAIGAVQALLGLLVAVEAFRAAGGG